MENERADFMFNRMLTQFKRGMETLPPVIGNEVVNFSKESFSRQGWLGDTFQPWKPRKVTRKRNRNKGRAILVDTARLKRSIRVISTTVDSVTVGTDVPYARAHNEGVNEQVAVSGHQRRKYSSKKVETGKYNKSGSNRMQTVKSISGVTDVKGHTRQMKMPKRQYLGNSQYMVARLKRVAAIHITKYFS